MQSLKSRLSPALLGNMEFQSALVRLLMWLFSLLYLSLGAATDYYRVDLPIFHLVFSAYLVVFLSLLIDIVRRPQRPHRSLIALLLDITATSITIFFTQEAISPFYLLYIWIFISYGTRYGEIHLRWASLLSMLTYNGLLIALDTWREQPLEAMFFLAVLAALPLYQYSLLEQLHTARQEAERANRAKSDFIAMLTHELRTPLSGVIGMARLLESTPLNPEQRDYVNSISVAGELLRGLIGDILDLSKIEAGKMHLETVAFDLRSLIHEICTTCARQAAERRLELICQIDPLLPTTLHGDALRLRQILLNLVGNALKFTHRGEVVVRAQYAPGNALLNIPHLYLEVQDTGIGISAAQQAQIFDRFWQADHSTTRIYGGTGLGTTIAHDLTQLMGGLIGLMSMPGQGSQFWLRLPLLPADFIPNPPPPDPNLSGRRVLLYEPHRTAHAVLEQNCRVLGLNWQWLDSVTQLTQLTAAGVRVDSAIIADNSAGENLLALQRLLQHGLGYAVPVLFLTYPGRRPKDLQVIWGCLDKPFLTQQLAQLLLTLGQTVPLPAPMIASLLPLKVLIAEDNAIAAKVLVTLLTRQGHQVVHALNGAIALQYAKTQPFNIAFLDLRMPELDGFIFAQQWRAIEPADQHLPLIALTADAAATAKARALAAGIDDFLIKPISHETLETMLRQYCYPGIVPSL